MSDWKGDNDEKISPEDLDMLRNLFGIQTSEQDRRLLELIEELKKQYGFVDKQMLIQKLMQEFGVDPEFLDQVQQDMADLNIDHLTHLINTDLHFETSCDQCFALKTELCDHIRGEERLEIMLQLGNVEEGLSYMESLNLSRLDQLLWRTRFYIINHEVSAMKALLDEASQIIYGDDDVYNIFRVQVLKIHYLLDQRYYDEALKVADSISSLAETVDLDENESITYWMASLSQGMASALLKMGQVHVALDPLLVSTDLFIKTGNQYQVSMSFAILSSVMGILQEGDKAKEAARKALKLMHQLDNEFGLIRVKTFVSSGFLALFETEIALDYATEALKSALPTGKNTIIAALYGLITQIHIVDNDYIQAMEVASTCYEYAMKQEIGELTAIAVALKGDILAEQNKIEEAIRYYDQAIVLLEDGKDDQLILDLDRRIADLEQLR